MYNLTHDAIFSSTKPQPTRPVETADPNDAIGRATPTRPKKGDMGPKKKKGDKKGKTGGKNRVLWRVWRQYHTVVDQLTIFKSICCIIQSSLVGSVPRWSDLTMNCCNISLDGGVPTLFEFRLCLHALVCCPRCAVGIDSRPPCSMFSST